MKTTKLVSQPALKGAMVLAITSVGATAFAESFNVPSSSLRPVVTTEQVEMVISCLASSGHIRAVSGNQFLISDQLQGSLAQFNPSLSSGLEMQVRVQRQGSAVDELGLASSCARCM